MILKEFPLTVTPYIKRRKPFTQRLLPDDKISRVNDLCEQIESAWRVGYSDTNKAFVERDLRGVTAMSETVSELDILAREEISQELKM